MGTRHIIAVQIDGEYKVAQYGQWDGYPSGQGSDILDYLKTWNRDKFTTNLRASRFVTEEDIGAINKQIKALGDNCNWKNKWPELSRDTAADILPMIEASPMKLKNSLSFAADSLFCEFGYVLDLDKNQLELYKGFNKSPIDAGARFFSIFREKDPEFYPIRLVGAWPLEKLPNVEEMEKAVAE